MSLIPSTLAVAFSACVLIVVWPFSARQIRAVAGPMALVTTLLTAPVTVAAADLAHARGPDGSGHLPGTLQPPLTKVWERKLGPSVTSAAVVVGEVIYVGVNDSSVQALSLADGSPLWRCELDSSPGGAPVYHDGALYVGSSAGTVYRLDPGDGTIVWEQPLDGAINGMVGVVAGKGDQPTTVVAGHYEGEIVGLDAADGSQRWLISSSDPFNGAPSISGGKAVVGGCDATVHVVDGLSGTEGEGYGLPEFIPASVTAAGDFILAPYGNPNDPMTMAAIDLTKNELLWEYEGDAGFKAMAAVTDDAVVFGGEDYLVHCVDRATGEARWTYETGGVVLSSPIVVGQLVIVGSDDGKLYLLDLASGKEVAAHKLGPGVTASPVVVGSSLLIGDDSGTFYRFDGSE